MAKKKSKKDNFSDNETFNENVEVTTVLPLVTDPSPQVTPTSLDSRPYYSPFADEEMDVYNESFNDEEIPPQTVFFDTPNNTDYDNIIGKVIVRKGRVIKYEIDKDQLWHQMLRIIWHRIKMSSGTACLLNLRTISKQITRECNIKSIAAVEGEVISLMSTKFGVKDIDSVKEPRGLKKLRGTAEFWGTVGSRTKHNRKRVARVYAVKDPTRIVKYIEGVIDVTK